MTVESHTKLQLSYSLYKNKYKENRKNLIFLFTTNLPCLQQTMT